MSDKGIKAKKKENFSEWYRELLKKSGLIDYSDVSGCIVLRPLAYSIWEKIKKEIDRRFKQIGIKNAYFPIFVPEKLLEKEAEHFEGFVPEVAWVTQAGKSKLKEKLAVRPTSEAIMYSSYAKWIRSWRDLPLKLNQWNNIVRWEFKHAIPLLRTREFLWQEGHNVYSSKEEALKNKDEILSIYQEVLENWLAVPGILGRKSEKEKFAGAVDSYSIEHLMPDGKALQGPTFHYDGTNFSKAFQIKYLDKKGEKKYAHQTTFGFATRELGAAIAIHSDQKGLIIPPKVASIKTVIIPIFDKKNKKKVLELAEKVHSMLKDSRLDDREEYTPGWKFNQWELKGVPIRIEIGSEEVKERKATLVRRDTGKKTKVNIKELKEKVSELLNKIQKELFERAKGFLEKNIRETESYERLKKIISERGGFVKARWCGSQQCEEKFKEETGAKITNIPFRYEKPKGKCICCGKPATFCVHLARSY